MSFTSNLGERREDLLSQADLILAKIGAGDTSNINETESIDFKEEAGRRGLNGELQPGEKTNTVAATKLADEVCCMANTPGGGILILGIEDKQLQILGTELDADWLRHQIYYRVEIAPAIEERTVAGQRILLLLVAESSEPVTDTSNRIRWRVGDRCTPVDRSEWWVKREASGGFDLMARESTATMSEITAGAMQFVRRSVFDDIHNELPEDTSDEVLLRHVGALRSNGKLTQAAKLLLGVPGRPLLTLTTFTVHGGDVDNFFDGDPQKSLLEQLAAVESRLDAINRSTVIATGFTEAKVRDIPPRAVRESILNGLIHRDWNSAHPTELTWITFDSTLIVKSPGGFTGEINEHNLLANRHARYPALADLFRALRLVDKQGVGVDRMYQSMIALGHRPPHIIQTVGPHVVCTLIGGKPVVPMMALIQSIRPEARQTDVRIAVILDALMNQSFIDIDVVAERLQTDRISAEVALRAATSSTIASMPLVEAYKDVWILGTGAFKMVTDSKSDIHEPRFMNYATTDRTITAKVIRHWLQSHTDITSGDLAQLTGISRPTALQILSELDGSLLQRVGSGRSTRYILAS